MLLSHSCPEQKKFYRFSSKFWSVMELLFFLLKQIDVRFLSLLEVNIKIKLKSKEYEKSYLDNFLHIDDNLLF